MAAKPSAKVTRGVVKKKKKKPYHKHALAAAAAAKVHAAAAKAATKAKGEAARAHKEHKVSLQARTIAMAKAFNNKTNQLGHVNSSWYKHANVVVPWKKFHMGYPPLTAAKITAKEESPEDDVEDMEDKAAKAKGKKDGVINSVGC